MPSLPAADDAPLAISGLCNPIDLPTVLEGTALTHLSSLLEGENLADWAKLSRVQLLQHLKELKVVRLIERQALANAFGRSQRGLAPDWKPPQPSAALQSPPSMSSPSASTPPKPPLPPKPLFDSTELVVPMKAESEDELHDLRRQLLSSTATYTVFGGYVRVVADAGSSMDTWYSVFGECPDRGCGCQRIKEPRVRSRFRNLVVERTAAQLLRTATSAASPVRYVSIGCGLLLTDVEILSGMVARGLTIEYVALVDPVYKSAASHNSLFSHLTALLPTARVFAFSSLESLERQVHHDPQTHGHVTTYLKIDSNDVTPLRSKGLAARLLIEGGLSFELSNDGPCKAGRSCWRRSDRPVASPDASDLIWGALLDPVALTSDEGCTSPLGECEPAESAMKPLYADADIGPHGPGGSTGPSTHWQSRASQQSLQASEAELHAVLNLL